MCIDLEVINDIKELNGNCQEIVLAEREAYYKSKREARKESWGTVTLQKWTGRGKQFW